MQCKVGVFGLGKIVTIYLSDDEARDLKEFCDESRNLETLREDRYFFTFICHVNGTNIFHPTIGTCESFLPEKLTTE